MEEMMEKEMMEMNRKRKLQVEGKGEVLQHCV